MVSSGAVSKLNVVGFSKAAAKVRGREGDRADGSTRLPDGQGQNPRTRHGQQDHIERSKARGFCCADPNLASDKEEWNRRRHRRGATRCYATAGALQVGYDT
jgi:hypothetical protein